MNSLFEKYAQNGFAEFRGLTVSGKIPVKEEVCNALIAGLLANSRTPSSPGAGSGIDFKHLAPLVKKAEVTADAGVITLHFDLSVD